jgi:hypothetical protein
LVAFVSVRQRSSRVELAGGAGGAEEGHFISAIVIEVDEVTLPAHSGADGAALAIATDEVRGNQSRIADNAAATSCPFKTGARSVRPPRPKANLLDKYRRPSIYSHVSI